MNITDRELLELAAKAAGFNYDETISDEYGSLYGRFVDESRRGIYAWNPRDDDGDALRLAVRLDISFRMDYSYPEGVRTVEVGVTLGNFLYADSVPTGNDPYAATRRAIVRAAAEIGKEMK